MNFAHASAGLFIGMLRTTVEASALIVSVWIIHRLLRSRIGPRWSYALWCLVLVRLLLPAVPEFPGGGLARQFASGEPSLRLGATSSSSAARSLQPAGQHRGRSGDAREPAEEAKPTPPAATGSAWVIPEAVERRANSRSLGRLLPSAAGAGRSLATGDIERSGGVRGESWLGPATLAGAAVWLLGALLLAARLAVRELRFRRLYRGLPAIDDARVLDVLGRCVHALAPNDRARDPFLSRVRVQRCDALDSPAAAGFLRPRVLLPGFAIDHLERDELESILLHELCHLRARDVLLNWVLVLLGAVHWFNPLVHFALRELRTSREQLRDWQSLRAAPRLEPTRYAQTFLRVLELGRLHITPTPPLRPSPAVGFLHERGELKRRIDMIRTFDCRPRGTVLGVLALVALGWASLTAASTAERFEAPEGAPPRIAVTTLGSVPEWLGEMRSKLAQPVELELDHASLAEFIELIALGWQVNVIASPDVLGEGYEVHHIRSHGRALSAVLSQALRPLGLGYGLAPRVVVVGDADDVPRFVQLRYYRVDALLDGDAEDADRLVDLVEEMAGGERAWERDDARLQIYNGLLCVRQSQEVHAEVEALLDDLLQRGRSERPAEPPWRARLEATLGQKVNVDFVDEPLPGIAEFLGQLSGVDITVPPDCAETTIDLRLMDVELGTVIQWICHFSELYPVLREGAIHLSPLPDYLVRMWEIQDLLPGEDYAAEEFDVLADLLQDIVPEVDWELEGTSLRYQRGLLILRHTEGACVRVAEALNSLRRALR